MGALVVRCGIVGAASRANVACALSETFQQQVAEGGTKAGGSVAKEGQVRVKAESRFGKETGTSCHWTKLETLLKIPTRKAAT